jgi:uncharacterized protein
VNRNTILKTLQDHRAEIHSLGIRSLALFGSLARDQAKPDSDVDLLADFDPPYTFDRYIRAKFFLEDLLGCPVDLVMPDTLKPRVKPEVEKEAIYVA